MEGKRQGARERKRKDAVCENALYGMGFNAPTTTLKQHTQDVLDLSLNPEQARTLIAHVENMSLE